MAFWYVIAGAGVVISAVLAGVCERRAGGLPASVGFLLLALTAFGGLAMPSGGFWLFLVPVVIIFWQSARRARRNQRPSSAGVATGSVATAERIH